MTTPAGVTWLSDLEPASFEGYTKLGRDQRWTTDERPLLLAGGGRLYARGLGMHAPSTAVYDLGGRFARLRARLALSDFAAAGGSVEFKVSADGAEIYHSPLVTHETEPIELDLDISGVQQLTLEALSGPDGVSGDHANWLDAALLAPGAEAPASSIGAPSGVGVDEAERPHLVEPEGVYQFGFDIDGGDAGMALVPKVWMDDYDPAAAPTAAPGSPVALAAARGESEPATALVFATRAQPGASVAVSDLRGPGGAVLPADRVTVRRVVRAPERRIYTTTADDTEITARFLPRWEPQDIGAGELREIWLAVDVPADAAPGDYVGELAVVSEGRRTALPLALTVYPFELDAPSDKQLGSYYRMAARLLQTEVLAAELADLRAHGIDNLVTDLGIGFRRDGDAVEPDYTELRRGLDLIRDSGLRGTVIVHDDLTTLAALLGIPRDEWDERLTQHEPFMAAAKTAIEGFLEVDAEYPELDLAVTHLDEVFNRDRLPTYLAMAAAVRQVPEAKLYVTFHTVNEEADAMRAQVDPFVDIRCNHGYSFELWLSRGHTMAEYEQELEAAGDVAWIYHNNRGTWFTAEWSRIINGLYLWASPFSVSAPWTYHSSHGNPYDDTDGGDRAHDFGLAFPSLTDDPADLVPTRDYEAMREGGHDLRYLATLERLVNERAADRPEAAAAGRALLARLRALVRDVTVQPADEAAVAEADAGMGAQIDLDTGLVMRTGNIGTQYEAPVINALAERFSGSQWQAIRREVAAAIAGLQ